MEFPNLVDEPASPDETLLEWHVFAGLELKVNNYAAVCSTATGGPFRAITVRDAIGDLPNIGNGACETTMEKLQSYSAFYPSSYLTVSLHYFWTVPKRSFILVPKEVSRRYVNPNRSYLQENEQAESHPM
ncbi:hypothetical protein PVL29_016267 [Vitis rotundifolia]|uniref:Uncharacterized protein n=1 Tax=Vitis rotundifolia TaxID=103349 RepID=A0AA39DLA4_VITRO|nr:hypothetical protein PVL29_016267 [Vitis rotundifolia]